MAERQERPAAPGRVSLKAILRRIKELGYGELVLKIHQGRVEQVEVTEKFRGPQLYDDVSE